MSSSSVLPINPSSIGSFAIAKRFSHNKGLMNSLDFSRDGELLAAANDDETLNVYNCVTGTLQHKTIGKRYGNSHVRFTKSNSNVLVASKNDWDQTIRYLNVQDNSYIRYFSGHRDAITSVSVSTVDDTFLSSSLDETVRLWDLRAPSCQGFIQRYGKMCAAFDPGSLIFAVASADNTIAFFDRRNYDKAPFAQYQMDFPPFSWRALEFSPNGQFVLLVTDKDVVLLMDAFTGNLLREFMAPESADILSITFSPDSEYVLAGTSACSIHAWNIRNGKEAAKLIMKDSVGALKWNSELFLLAAGDDQLNLLLPTLE